MTHFIYFGSRIVLVRSRGAVTEYHRLGGLQTTEIYFSQFWRLGHQGAYMVG